MVGGPKGGRHAGKDREAAQVHGRRARAEERRQEDAHGHEREGARENGEQGRQQEEELTRPTARGERTWRLRSSVAPPRRTSRRRRAPPAKRGRSRTCRSQRERRSARKARRPRTKDPDPARLRYRWARMRPVPRRTGLGTC